MIKHVADPALRASEGRVQVVFPTAALLVLTLARHERPRALTIIVKPASPVEGHDLVRFKLAGELFNALYDLPQLLVDHPLAPSDAADLTDELRSAITLLDSAPADGAQHDAQCENPSAPNPMMEEVASINPHCEPRDMPRPAIPCRHLRPPRRAVSCESTHTCIFERSKPTRRVGMIANPARE